MRRRVQHRSGLAVAALLVILVTSAGSHLQAGQTYGVSPSGDDAGPGTISAPFETLARALRALCPGDTLLVRGGVYVESLEISSSNGYASGTAGAPITVRAHPGETPVLWAEPVGERIALRMGPDLAMGHWELEGLAIGGASTRAGFFLSGVRSVRISGCRWDETLDDGSRGIVITDGSRDIRVTGCRFDRPLADAITIAGDAEAEIRHNEFEGFNGDHAIIQKGDGGSLMIAENLFRGALPSEGAILLNTGHAGARVTGNIFADIGGGAYGLSIGAGGPVSLEDNVFLRIQGPALIADPGSRPVMRGSLFFDNLRDVEGEAGIAVDDSNCLGGRPPSDPSCDPAAGINGYETGAAAPAGAPENVRVSR